MRIAFIWPHANTVYQTLPLSIGVLHSSIKHLGHTTKMFNLPLEGWQADSPEFRRAMEEFAPDLIAASAWACSFKATVEAVRVAREASPRAIAIVGGNYPTLNPAQAWAPGCFDYLLMGECEKTFPRFLELLEAKDEDGIAALPGAYFHRKDGTIVRNKNPFVENLDELGPVDYDFIDLERCFRRGYMRTLLGPKRKVAMVATRGCAYACNFCTAPLMNGQHLRHYSVPFLTGQIRLLYEKYGVRMIYFMDDNGTQDHAFFKDLCRGIAAMALPKLKLELYRGIRLENLDEEMLVLMKQAGFDVATIAPESGSERVRTKLMKKDMKREDIVRIVKLIKKAGLSAQGYFIVGFPGETAEERRMSYRFARELELDVFSLHKYMALPGTPTFLKLVKDGRIVREHTDEAHLIGEGLPNFNGDDPARVDREIFGVYARFYLLKPWKFLHLFRMASVGGLWRSIFGTFKAAVTATLHPRRAPPQLPAARAPE